jgi:hypothetical protein
LAGVALKQKCHECQERLSVEEEKWKKIGEVVNKRKKITQRNRESMLGYHLKNTNRLALNFDDGKDIYF